MTEYLRLLRHPRFRLLLSGQIISLLADAIFPMVVVTAVAQHATGYSIAVIFAARAFALGGLVLFAGGLIDRVNPVAAAVTADTIRLAALLAFALTWDGRLGVGALIVAVIVGACEAVSEPALLVIAPTVAESDPDDSGPVYALLDTLRHGATVVGPVLAAVIASALGVGSAAALAAGFFGLSAAATRIAGARVARPPRTDDERAPLVRDAVAGLKPLWNIPWIRIVHCISLLHVLLAVGPWTVILPTVVLAQSGSTARYGMLLSAFALGAVGGALLGGKIRGPHRGIWAMLLLSLFGFTVFTPALTAELPLLVLAFVLGGVGQEACDVVKMTAMRKEIPEKYWGRAFSADFFFSFAALPVGQLIGAALVSILDAHTLLIVAGAMVSMTSLLVLLSADMRRFATSQSAPDGG